MIVCIIGSRMNFPDHLKYTKDHLWVKPGDGEVVIGITFFAQLELGEIAYVDVKTTGKHLQNGQVFGRIEAVKASPVCCYPLVALLGK